MKLINVIAWVKEEIRMGDIPTFLIIILDARS
jgi:hypothetical protein